MSDQASKIVRQLTSWRGLKASVLAVLIALTGCFGAPAMHYDIQEYNKAVVSSEQEMLLFNVGRLYRKQPPHFMMLSSIAQGRTFSAGASFQWAQVWNSLFLAQKDAGSTAKGTDAFTAGPFTAGATENPTSQFVPIQGTDFAQRFEAPVTDKFLYFFEDQRWYARADDYKNLVLLFAQSLYLTHGETTNGKPCSPGLHRNGRNGDVKFSDCVTEILKSQGLDYVQIDGSHPVPTKASEAPKAADLVSALQAGYKWNENGDKLTVPIRIPAWLDYNPKIVPPRSKQPPPPDQLSPVWWSRPDKPDWHGLAYKLPKDYQWKFNADPNKPAQYKYALVPDGYVLGYDKKGNYALAKPKEDEAKKEVQLSYSDEIVSDVWPVWQDYFYVELRKGAADDATAERICHPQTDYVDYTNNTVICGYFKIGNFLQIMQRLADQACTSKDPEDIEKYCPQSIFGIGPEVPSWADGSASYKDRERTDWIWVPAHDPQTDHVLAERDRTQFLTLYKLYQMSLVDTSKLVTGLTPITISK